MHKPNSIFDAADKVLFTEAVKFMITPKMQEHLDGLAEQVSLKIKTEKQIDALMKEVDKISMRHMKLEEKYWAEVDKQGFDPRHIAGPAMAALHKVATAKK